LLPSQAQKDWIFYLDHCAERLAYSKAEAPIDLIEYVNSMRSAFSNPTVQCFQTQVKVLDKDGQELVLRFPQVDTIEHVKIAQSEGHWPYIQAYLEASSVGVTAREAIQALSLLKVYESGRKPQGFTAKVGLPVDGETIPTWCQGILGNWVAQNGDIDLSRRSKTRPSSQKSAFYTAEVAVIRKKAEAMAKTRKSKGK